MSYYRGSYNRYANRTYNDNWNSRSHKSGEMALELAHEDAENEVGYRKRTKAMWDKVLLQEMRYVSKEDVKTSFAKIKTYLDLVDSLGRQYHTTYHELRNNAFRQMGDRERPEPDYEPQPYMVTRSEDKKEFNLTSMEEQITEFAIGKRTDFIERNWGKFVKKFIMDKKEKQQKINCVKVVLWWLDILDGKEDKKVGEMPIPTDLKQVGALELANNSL